MLYISKDRSAVQIEEGVYLHVFNPRLSDAPSGAIVARGVGKHGLILDYNYRDGSSLSISIGRDNIIVADLVFRHETAVITISHTLSRSQYMLPSDPILHVFNTRDRVITPLLIGDADNLDSSFFDAPTMAVALVLIDEQKNLLYIDSPREAPSLTIRETGKGKGILSLSGRIIETLEQAGIKTVVEEV